MKNSIIKIFKNEKLILLFISLIFSIFLISNIHFPGIWNDEAAVGETANQISRVIHYGGSLPRIGYIHPATVAGYLAFPFVYLFGANIFALRLPLIFYALISLWLIYYLCKDWFGKKVALITFLLTATNIAFVQYTKVGNFHKDPYVVFLFWIGLFFLWKYFKKQKIYYLFLGFFIFGVALSVKITFLGYIVALIVTYLIWRKRANLFNGLRFRHLLIAFFSFCAGNFFLLEYNLRTGGAHIRLLLGSLVQTTRGGVNNLDFLNNFSLRIAQLIGILKANNIEYSQGWGVIDSTPIGNTSGIIFGLVLISFIVVFIFAISKRVKPLIPRKKILFLYIFYGVVFLCTPFTVWTLSQEHLIFLFPFPQIVCALFLGYSSYWFRKRRIALTFIYSCFLILPLFYNVQMNVHYAAQMRKNGGSGVWSTAIYDLVDYLQRNKIKRPICFFQEPATSIGFISHYEAKKVLLGDSEDCFKFFGSTPNDPAYVDKTEIIKKLIVETYEKYYLNKQDHFYIITMDSVEKEFSQLEALKLFAKDYGKHIILEKIFLNRAGEPIYYLYKIY